MLERVSGDEAMRLRGLDDEIEVNPALRFRLERGDVDVALPPLPEEEAVAAGEYLQAVMAAVAGRAGWTVRPECVLGRFSFLKFAMYRDLEALAPRAPRHPLVAALAGDTDALLRLPAVALPAPEALDGEEPPLHILDADPSQSLAILAARRGQSFVLQGPPGTGKSQTIANIIAQGMADGKRILFVSQKMAALDAVYQRLRDRGLAGLCLEAHSHKAGKKHLLEQLRAALDARPPLNALHSTEGEEARQLARALNETVAALHAPRPPLGLSVYEANGLAARLADAPDLPFVFTGPEAVSRADYGALEELAERLAGQQSLLPELHTHPWRGVRADRFGLELQTRARAALETGLDALDGLEREGGYLARLCALNVPSTAREIDRLLSISALALETPRPPVYWLTDAEP